MKIRSKGLFAYLTQVGALNGTQEQIALAKAEYRRLYKREWKRRSSSKKEIRFYLTLAQYGELQRAAALNGALPSTFAKQSTLRAVGIFPVCDPRLLELLQMVSVAINQSSRRRDTDFDALLRVETFLLNYLKAV